MENNIFSRNFNENLAKQKPETFLKWVLTNCFYLGDKVNRCICEGKNDQGIDGIFVNEWEEEISFYQSKFKKNSNENLGYQDPKNFWATIELLDGESIKSSRDQANNKLKKIIEEENLLNKIKTYTKKAIFITNGKKNKDTDTFYKSTKKDNSTKFEIWDYEKLQEKYKPLEEDEIENTLTFNIKNNEIIAKDKCLIFTLSTKEFIDAISKDIESGVIFNKNIRKYLGGKNKISNPIKETLADEPENILLYHNGITLVAKKIEKKENSLKLENCSIVNGCQSTTVFFHNKDLFKNNALILIKAVEVKNDDELINKITHNANNQNPTQIRDLKSNDLIQKILQRDFKNLGVYYSIKGGEKNEGQYTEEIKNNQAASLITSFYYGKSHLLGRKQLFDNYYHYIFTSQISAEDIYIFYKIFLIIKNGKDEIQIKNIDGFHKKDTAYHFLLSVLAKLGMKEILEENKQKINFKTLKSKITKVASEFYEKILSKVFVKLVEKEPHDYQNNDIFRENKKANKLREEVIYQCEMACLEEEQKLKSIAKKEGLIVKDT